MSRGPAGSTCADCRMAVRFFSTPRTIPTAPESLADFCAPAAWKRSPIVFAAMRDKDIAGMLRPLAAVCGDIRVHSRLDLAVG